MISVGEPGQEQAAPLMPPELLDVLTACPTTKTWKTRGRPPGPGPGRYARPGAAAGRGFYAALRRPRARRPERRAGHRASQRPGP
ncbi:MAG: hypothetical protein L0I24_00840 [Pseudonocardia sp.]|nr:hypothetical protein [Pseudonocardia sp.]